MNISNSPDINDLSVKAIWDISGRTPTLYLQNLSTGANLANVDYAFIILSPSETNIYNGSLNQPDIEGIWTTFTFFSSTPDPLLSPPPTNYIVAGWPRPFNQIEWSGAPYQLFVLAKDSVGNTWTLPITQTICRPSGNTNISITTYGKGLVGLQMDCDNAQAFFEDVTNSSYRGLSGTLESSQLRVNYPDDETDAAPTPFIINHFATALVPITYDSNNYEFIYTAVYLYDFGNNSYVRVKYYTKERFSVSCNIDLCPLVCEYEKLLAKAERGECGNVAETNKTLLQINGKMNLAMIAKTQPLCGIDLPVLIDEIKALGGFQCDCCTPSGVKPFNSANLADYNFQIISGGGDISGTVNVTGNNIQFTLYDKNYIFRICETAPTTAFTITPSTSGFTRTFCLNVDMVQLSGDILNTIKNNVSLVNLFNSIVDFGSVSTKLIVDGGCIFESTSSCDYTYIIASVPASVTYVLLTSIKVGEVIRPVYFAFNQTNLGALQAYLNGLGIGTFTVTYTGSGNVLIASLTNTSDLGDLTYQITATSYIAAFTKNCTGYLPMDASQVVQMIISYLCAIDDSQMVTSQIYTICYAVDNSGGSPPTSIQEQNIPIGTPLNVLIAAMLDRNCTSINYFGTFLPVFRSGLTKTGNFVEFGGTALHDTTLNMVDKDLDISGTTGNLTFQDNTVLLNTPQSLFSAGTIIAGRRYRINNNSGGANFMISGAASNTVGVEFISNGVTPSWGTGSLELLGVITAAAPYAAYTIQRSQHSYSVTPSAAAPNDFGALELLIANYFTTQLYMQVKKVMNDYIDEGSITAETDGLNTRYVKIGVSVPTSINVPPAPPAETQYTSYTIWKNIATDPVTQGQQITHSPYASFVGIAGVNSGDTKIGINSEVPTAALDVTQISSGASFRVRQSLTPASAAAVGNVGDWAWDASYFYICIATNTWHRAAHAIW